MNTPWDTIPKTPFDKLTDVFVLGPEISRKGDRLKCLPPDRKFAAALELTEDLSHINQRLQDVYDEYEKIYSGKPLYQEHGLHTCNCPEDAFTGIDEKLVFPSAFCFVDQETSSFLNIYCMFHLFNPRALDNVLTLSQGQFSQ